MSMFFGSPFSIPIVAIASVFIWLSITTVAEAISAAKKHQADAELKRSLAERGMSADEIAMVVRAGRGKHKEPAEPMGGYSEAGPHLAATVAHPPTKQARRA
jgi:hypothetical protein